MVKATSLIGADNALEIQSLGFALEVRMKFFCSQIRTTTPWIVFGTLVGADKDVSLKGWHQTVSLNRHGEGVESFHE